MAKKLSIFATYWNEKDWIRASLAQIDALEAKQVFIVDGCFDPRIENRSVDGTREIIETWAKERPHVTVVSASRMSRVKNLWYLFGKGITWKNLPIRLVLFFYYARTSIYRLNQASTFTKLLRESGVQPGDWVTHCDSDQFYSDELLAAIKNQVRESARSVRLLTADELTFFADFKHFTRDYEKRNYNNLPYRYEEDTIIVPTRDVVTEKFPKPVALGKDPSAKALHLGTYHHYKFRPYDTERAAATYTVGDRKAPDTCAFIEETYTGEYPSVIKQGFDEMIHGVSHESS